MSLQAFIDLTSVDEDDEKLARTLQEEFNTGVDEEEEDDDDSFTEGDENDFFELPVQYEEDPPFPQTVQLESLQLSFGVIKPGDTVELKDHSKVSSNRRRYGDFLWIRSIVENLETNEIFLCGDRLRRLAHLAPIFDLKMNDVAIVRQPKNNGSHPFAPQNDDQVLEDEAIGKRDCEFTSLDFHQLGISSAPILAPKRLKEPSQIKEYIFNNGKVYCRWLLIEYMEKTGKSYGGMVRRIYKQEAAERNQHKERIGPTSQSSSMNHSEDKSSTLTKRQRSASLEELTEYRRTRPTIHPKASQYTMMDVFCGAGGASVGAVRAGLIIKFGLDMNPIAMESFALNHPNALHLCMDAHNLPGYASRACHYCDHIHFSSCCQYFSVAHSFPGKDDEQNYLTIFVPGAVLGKLKPPYATAEQTPGLINLQKHKKTFRLFLNDLLNNGYNVHYKVYNFANFGLPQSRRRLLFTMARRGFPLPPFLNSTHGPKGSGLKRYVTVADALKPLERIIPGHLEDDLHQPERMKQYNATPYDPHTELLPGCITTSGGENYHYSGTRKFTPREYSIFQGFGLEARFVGSNTEVIKQLGNAYPPPAAEHHILSCAMTREAFDNGLIDSEEDIQDLVVTLEQKGIRVPEDLAHPKFRYLNRLTKSDAFPDYVPSSIWSKIQDIEPIPRWRPEASSPPPMQVPTHRQRKVIEEAKRAAKNGNLHEIH